MIFNQYTQKKAQELMENTQQKAQFSLYKYLDIYSQQIEIKIKYQVKLKKIINEQISNVYQKNIKTQIKKAQRCKYIQSSNKVKTYIQFCNNINKVLTNNKILQYLSMIRNSLSLSSQKISQELHNNNKVDHVAQIFKLINQIDKTTDKLDQKLQVILRLKQIQFFNSYKHHMKRIKDELDLLHTEIEIKDKKINSYESQGTYATLFKRIKQLEDTQRRLLSDLSKKNSNIKQLGVEKLINKSENKRLEQKVKQLLRNNAKSSVVITENANNYQSQITFPTQVTPQIELNLNNYRHNNNYLKAKRSLRTNVTVNPELQFNIQVFKLQKQVNALQKQNRKLISLNNKLLTDFQQSQKFFMSIVSQMRKNICIRKQIQYCSLEDFRKEDKISLLIKVLSNDQILIYLYNKIFSRNNQHMYQKFEDLTEKKKRQQTKASLPHINNTMKLV